MKWNIQFFANNYHICPSNFDRLLLIVYQFNIWKSASILLTNQVFFEMRFFLNFKIVIVSDKKKDVFVKRIIY